MHRAQPGEFGVVVQLRRSTRGLTCTSTGSIFNAVPYCLPVVEFKKFGVSMQFTPVVLGAGKISLKVMTEVSDLSSDNSITLNQLNSNTPITIPSLRVRRAETSVEIPSAGALAMAGMIQEQTLQALNVLPGLMEVPILGTLFRSRDYLNRQTELMILVAPHVVHAVASKELARPDDGYADAPIRRPSCSAASTGFTAAQAPPIRRASIAAPTAS